MANTIQFGDIEIGAGLPALLIGEIGINHNGSMDLARDLILAAKNSGLQAVKFQLRTPDLCVPEDQKLRKRDTPWGQLTYLDYRKKIEFSQDEYRDIHSFCRKQDLPWFASPWDLPSLSRLLEFNPPAIKIASACLTDKALLVAARRSKLPVFLSTGMSTLREVDAAVELLGTSNLVIFASTSSYPLEPSEANLKVIPNFMARYGVPIGYSGHERGIQISLAAIALGACVLERHITVDRSLWGTDQAASLEPQGISRLVRDVRVIEAALGDGLKRVYPSELEALRKLRIKSDLL